MKTQKGFTLIELAIVLVIIGLILGMVFKGRQLIENAKVKSLAAQYNKIHAAVNTFYDRYGFLPGDGCRSHNPTDVSQCNRPKNGRLDNINERRAFFNLLVNVYGMLSASDIQSSVGGYWHITSETVRGKAGNWLYISTYNPLNSASTTGAPVEKKYVCALDKAIDDGEAATGDIRLTGGTGYTANTDCWTLDGTYNNERLFLF